MFKGIGKPDLSGVAGEKITELLQKEGVRALVQKSFAPYCHWEKLKHQPIPEGIRPEELWAVVKFIRREVIARRESVIRDEKGAVFSWLSWLPGIEELLHQVDMKVGGNLFVFGGHVDERMRHQLLSRGVMEEAIASSQLEGAHSTRKAAKQMLLEGRNPRTKDEHMIVNNYRAMRMIEDELRNKALDEGMLFLLHETLTKNTLDKDDIGRYRRDEDDIVVGNEATGEIYHKPPSEIFLKKEIKRVVEYANNKLSDQGFVHPVIKAIFIHFWFGYLHPFVDGNGRMARALFYWYLLREKYWAFGFLPLSKVIKNSPGQYRDAYIFSEQDDNDLTYFLDYNARKISQALREFELYARRKWQENTHMAKRARDKYELNDRQIQLLRYFYKNKDATTSMTVYTKVYEVARMTAVKDIKRLKESGFITPKKVGRIVYYYPTDKVLELFD